MAKNVEDRISSYVQTQFPAFYQEEGPLFVAFVKAYTEFLEQEDNTVDVARNLLEYYDIDQSVGLFIDQFKKTYLQTLPFSTQTDTKFLVKHIFDLYRSKGSPRAVELLFRLVFGTEASIYEPARDVLRPSDADYYVPRYIEVYAPDLSVLQSLEGREIEGVTSGAKAFVESISAKLSNSRIIYVLELSNLRGDFQRDELITSTGELDGHPVTTGSLSTITVDLGGANSIVGDTFFVESPSGRGGKARVTDTFDGTGRVIFSLLEGGFGFSTNTSLTQINVNDAYIFYSNPLNANSGFANTSGNYHDTTFDRWENIIQPVETLTVLSGASFFGETPTVGQYVTGRQSGFGSLVANGYIVSVSNTGANGTISLCVISGTFAANSQEVAYTSNTAAWQDGERVLEGDRITLTVTDASGFSVTDQVAQASGANGEVVVVTTGGGTEELEIENAFGTFNTTDNVYRVAAPSTNTAVSVAAITERGANASITSSNATHLIVADVQGAFGAIANTIAIKIIGERTSAIATEGAVTATGADDIYLIDNTNANAIIDTFANDFIVAQVIDSNTTSETMGAIGNTVAFYTGANAFVYGDVSNTYAEVANTGTGRGASFEIGSLENEESIVIYTDVVGENNVANVAFLDIVIQGSNSGVGFVEDITISAGGLGHNVGDTVEFINGGLGGANATVVAVGNVTSVNGTGGVLAMEVTNQGQGYYNDNVAFVWTFNGGAASTNATLVPVFDWGYGFGGTLGPSGGYLDTIDDVLVKISATIGSITSLTRINPGENYNVDPFISVYTPFVAKFMKRDFDVYLQTPYSGAYIVGESVNQTVSKQTQEFTVNDTLIQYANGDPAALSEFADGAGIVFVKNATVNVVATISSTVSPNTVIVVDTIVKDNTSGTLVTSLGDATDYTGNTTIQLANGYVNAPFTGVSDGTSLVSSKGQVLSSNSTAVKIRRLSFFNTVQTGANLVGATSGATGNVISVVDDPSTNAIGDNANISANVQTANGIVSTLEVIDSGLGYVNGEELTLVSTDPAKAGIVVTGIATVNATGIAEGIWRNTDSFLNSDKYIHDNLFYTEYAYQVRTDLSFDRYEAILKNTLHVAGAALFGAVVQTSVVNSNPSIANSTIETGL